MAQYTTTPDYSGIAVRDEDGVYRDVAQLIARVRSLYDHVKDLDVRVHGAERSIRACCVTIIAAGSSWMSDPADGDFELEYAFADGFVFTDGYMKTRPGRPRKTYARREKSTS